MFAVLLNTLLSNVCENPSVLEICERLLVNLWNYSKFAKITDQKISKNFLLYFTSWVLLLQLKIVINPLSANFTKWSNTLKQFVGNLPTNCLSVFDHFVGLALIGLHAWQDSEYTSEVGSFLITVVWKV